MTGRSWRIARAYAAWPLLAGLLLLLVGRYTGRKSPWICGWISLTAAAAATLMFFRDPERTLEPETGVLYAAADGLVTDVDEVDEPWVEGGKAERISVFLNLHNVHVNRSPLAGRVEKVEEVGGGFSPALFGGAEENYRFRTFFAGDRGAFIVVQRAGMIARRISPWVEKGQKVEAGERIGLIHFGSRTDVLVPKGEVSFLVQPKDRVRAGITPIARYRQGN